MNPTVRALFLVLAVVLTAQHAAAEEWHGIKPGHSTRADVVRVFGECSDPGKRCEFVFENDEISIDFSTPGNCHSSPPGTVLLIKKVLKDAKTTEALGLDQGRFKSFDPSFPKNSGYRAFVDEQSGLLFKTLRGDVFEIYYIPAKNDGLVFEVKFEQKPSLSEKISGLIGALVGASVDQVINRLVSRGSQDLRRGPF